MAKSNSFFSLRRGSTKSHTYQVYRGQQITKDRVTDVKNPQSDGQMAQRLKLPMVANYVAQLKGILNHSFEGVEYGEKSLSYARSQNLRKGALNVHSYVPKGMGNAGVADFLVSKGTLNPPGESGLTYRPKGSATRASVYAIQMRDVDESNFFTIADLPEGNVTSAQMQKLGLLFFSPIYDQLTIIAAYGDTDYQFTGADGNDHVEPYNRYLISRLVFDEDRFSENSGWKVVREAKDTATYFYLRNGIFQIELGYVETAALEITTTQLTNSLDSIFIELDTTGSYSTYDILMMAAISSDLDNSQWKRSRENFVVNTDVEGVSYDDAAYTYLNGTNDVSSTKYLNTGTQSTGITGGKFFAGARSTSR